jgi:hypothetical protein
MNPRTTGLLALAAAILGGFIYFYEIAGESGRLAARDEEKRIFPGLDAADVDAIELTTDDGIEARFERQEGRWRVVSPLSGRADATALDAIADALTSLPREGSVASASGPDQFGLGQYARTVLFEIADESKGLRIGRSTPVGGHVYVARLDDDEDGDENEIAYTESYRVNAFKRRLDDLRDRRVFGFDAGEVRTLRVAWPAAYGEVDGEVEVALARDESGEWQMGVPAIGRADQQTIRELLSDLSFLRAEGFVDERTDSVDAALANSAITFYWTLDEDHLERRARIAADSEGGLLVEGPTGELHAIALERMDDFKRSVSDYRFKMLSEFEVADARRLILEFADEGEGATRVEAALAEAGWTSEETRIDPNRASDLVRALASLRAEDIIADEMGPDELASLGLSPPRVRIRIEDRAAPDEETQILAEVAIGRLDEDRGLFAQRIGGIGGIGGVDGVGDGMVYLLPPSAVDDLPSSRAAFSSDFEIRSGDPASDGEELDPEILGADPLEGVEIP